jgi:hypothetical protein
MVTHLALPAARAESSTALGLPPDAAAGLDGGAVDGRGGRCVVAATPPDDDGFL